MVGAYLGGVMTTSPLSEELVVQAALKAVGLSVNSVWDLVNVQRTPPAALPVLIDLLPRVNDPKLKEALVRALSVRDAGPSAVEVLCREMARLAGSANPSVALAWAVGNALAVVVGEDARWFGPLSELLRDRRLGIGRQMLVRALARTGDQRVVDLLTELLPDGELSGHVLIALGQLGAPSAATAIRPFLHDPNAWLRREARKALKQVEGRDRPQAAKSRSGTGHSGPLPAEPQPEPGLKRKLETHRG